MSPEGRGGEKRPTTGTGISGQRPYRKFEVPHGLVESSPQILIGASSSRRIGWLMKMSRDLVQRYRISCSASCTCFPGLLPRTARREIQCVRFQKEIQGGCAARREGRPCEGCKAVRAVVGRGRGQGHGEKSFITPGDACLPEGAR